MAKKTAKFVLIIGDEGGILSYLVGGRVERRFFAASANYADSRAMQEALEADPKAPIYLLVDVMDQSYVQQSLPPVSSLSINKLIKRKMDRDFAADDLKGALLIGREKEGRKDWKYLFVTLSQSPQLQAWVDMIIDLPNQFKGLYLLPVEAENFMHSLRDMLSGKKHKNGKPEEGEARWQLLVAHNKVGGFRQVVLRDGKLIFARLAQPIGDSQPEVIAGSIEQEISVTVEYLKRLGYNDEQGLEFYIITSEAIKKSIDNNNLPATQVYLMTPDEASSRMGYEGVTEPGDQYADIVLSAGFARAKKHSLKLDTAQSLKLNGLYAAMMGIKVTAALLVVVALGAVGFYGFQIPGVMSEKESLDSQVRSVEQQLQDVIKTEEALPKDLERITDIVTLHGLLNDLGYQPLDAYRMLQEFKRTTNLTFFISEMKWLNKDNLLEASAAPAAGRNPAAASTRVQTVSFEVTFDLFETKAGTKEFLKRQQVFDENLKKIFADYTVELTSKLPGESDQSGVDVGLESDKIDPLISEESYELKYTMTGPNPKADDADAGKAEKKR